MIVRPHYLDLLKTYRDVPLVKILAGIRRCGKSTILEMLRDDLIKSGVPADHIIHMRYTSEDFDDGMTDKDMYNGIKEKMTDDERYYLLLDEAFDGLDVVIRKALKGILVEGVTGRNMTTVIASHNLRELEDLCDSVGLVHNGHMVLSDEVDSLKSSLHKVQAAFRGVPDVTAFSGLDVIKAERSGSLLQLIVRGDEEEIMNYINRLSPIFSECIEPSLEETFVYELEVNGYDVKSIAE